MKAWKRFVATGFYAGFSPFAPGTFGSVIGLLIAVICFRIALHPAVYLLLTMLIFLLGLVSSNALVKELKQDDPQVIVVDEIVGVLITFVGFLSLNVFTGIAGFILFRLFDILKPYPIRKLEQIPGGLGVMMDDVLAGLYSNLCLQVLTRVLIK